MVKNISGEHNVVLFICSFTEFKTFSNTFSLHQIDMHIVVSIRIHSSFDLIN